MKISTCLALRVVGGLAMGILVVVSMQAQSSKSNPSSLPQIVGELQQQVIQLSNIVQSQAATIRRLESALEDQNANIAGLKESVNSHTDKLKFVSVEGTEMFITGANLNIRDGSGATSGTPGLPYIANTNGLGNLIIGYNENGVSPCVDCLPQAERSRTGSHNLILGSDNGYQGFGSIVAGFANTSLSPYASITGGGYNTASEMFTNVNGGQGNTAKASGAAISGGLGNSAGGRWAVVLGGSSNIADGESATVCGGSVNTASGIFSTVSGGAGNKATAQNSSVSGGAYVQLDQQFAWAAGTLVNP